MYASGVGRGPTISPTSRYSLIVETAAVLRAESFTDGEAV
jgi:hypothetical protein